MRIEIKEYVNDEYAKKHGIYREYYFCSSCNTRIGRKTYDKGRQFSQYTILYGNEFPNFCPNCGKKLNRTDI